jgi:hypothetical protein
MKLLLNIVLFLIIIIIPCTANVNNQHLLNRLQSEIPAWMKQQADLDLVYFENRAISLANLYDYYDSSSPDLYLAKFTIQDNQIRVEQKIKNSPGLNYRCKAFEDALKSIAEAVRLPDVVFLMSMHDAFTVSEEVPVFSMCKRNDEHKAILLPDFEALYSRFQVLPHRDLILYEPLWKTKKDTLIWRGSTAQGSLDGELMRLDNIDRFSRVILCKLSQQYPELIDAKFTFFAQGGEHIPSLQQFKAKQMPFEQLVEYKYQLFIDGIVSPYSASGWKWFINSLILKPNSPFIQWYFSALKPFEHYIPVEADLSDLVGKIEWARSHETESQRIAKNAREFALTHITPENNLLYLYYILCRYSLLNFTD